MNRKFLKKKKFKFKLMVLQLKPQHFCFKSSLRFFSKIFPLLHYDAGVHRVPRVESGAAAQPEDLLEK